MAQVNVVSGPAGVGKGTLVAGVLQHHPEVWLSVSVTTRAPRPGEIDGVHYHFLTEPQFDKLLADNGLLEWALVHGSARYGTPRAPVERAVAEGRTVILEIELQGARQIRNTWPQAAFIFVAPPSWEELVNRLAGRNTETPAQRERRLQTARGELAAQTEFDHVIVNADLGVATDELVGLIGL